MKAKHLLYPFLCLALAAAAHAQVVTSVPVTFGADGQLTLDDVDISGAAFHVLSPVTASDCRLDLSSAAALEVAGGTVAVAIDTVGDLSFNGGMADLKKDLYLNGTIMNETDRSTFTISPFAIVRTVILSAGHTMETGLGLTLSISDQHREVAIRRINQAAARRQQESVARLYEFSEAVALSSVSFRCRAADLAAMENPQLYYRHETKGSWDQVYESGPAGADVVTGNRADKATALTVFDANEIYCPSYFSPNGDGINDLYEIENSYRYPDSRLVVMTRRGKVVYDKTPYRNDFNGGDLKADTYYFVFYKAAADDKPMKKWAVDIIR